MCGLSRHMAKQILEKWPEWAILPTPCCDPIIVYDQDQRQLCDARKQASYEEKQTVRDSNDRFSARAPHDTESPHSNEGKHQRVDYRLESSQTPSSSLIRRRKDEMTARQPAFRRRQIRVVRSCQNGDMIGWILAEEAIQEDRASAVIGWRKIADKQDARLIIHLSLSRACVSPNQFHTHRVAQVRQSAQ
jgi:hypothetical protein